MIMEDAIGLLLSGGNVTVCMTIQRLASSHRYSFDSPIRDVLCQTFSFMDCNHHSSITEC